VYYLRNFGFFLLKWRDSLLGKSEGGFLPQNPKSGMPMRRGSPALDKCLSIAFLVMEVVYNFLHTSFITKVNFFVPIRKMVRFTSAKVLRMTERFYLFVISPKMEAFLLKFARKGGSRLKENLHIILFISFLLHYVRSTTTTIYPRLYLICVICGIVFICVTYKPFWGLLLYYTTQLVILKEIMWFPDYMIPLGIPLLMGSVLFWLLGKVVYRRDSFELYQNPVNYILIFMWLVLSCSTLFTKGSVEMYLNLTTLFMGYFWAVQIVGTDKKKFVNFLSLLALIYGFYAWRVVRNGFYFGFGTGHPITAGFSSGALADNNELAAVMGVGVSFLLGLFFVVKGKWLKTAALSTSCLLVIAVILTNSRGGLIGLCIALFFTSLNILLKKKNVGVFLFFVLLFGILGSSVFSTQIKNHVYDILHWNEVPSARNRVIGVWGGWQILKGRPILGCGLDRLQNELLDVIPPVVSIPNINFWEHFTEERVSDNILLPKPRSNLVVHNAYISIGAQGGVGILLLFPSMLICVLVSQRRFRKAAKNRAELAWAVSVSYCLETAMYTYMVTAMFLNSYMGNTLYLIVLLSSCLVNVASKKERKSMSGSQFFFILVCFMCWGYFFLDYYIGTRI